MTEDPWLLVGLGAATAAAVLTIRGFWPSSWSFDPRPAVRKTGTTKPSAPAAVVHDGVAGLQDKGEWLKVATSERLLAAVQAKRVVDHMVRQSHLSLEAWGRDLQPAIDRYAELVQLLPASESHHHAHAGGLLAHTLEVVLAAMTWRNGTLLPQGASAEQIDHERDHWTYVVFYAALLHDIGKILTDLRVEWRVGSGSVDSTRWMPVAGSLVDCKASSYRVAFTPKAERDYAAHQRLSIQLLSHVAPTSARSFMAQLPHALMQLQRFLNGEDKDSALAQLVRRADQASTSRGLATGSRAKFLSSTAVSLHELLMGAMRDMLSRGAILPLNRDGAAGWVYDGSVWFVAKRLADAVRDHLKQHAPDEGVPGETKNDRLFDVWQEYGVIVPNPANRKAVWHVRVHGAGADPYSHVLSMLRFPMHKLWDSPDQYPANMLGQIEVLPTRGAGDEEESPSSKSASSSTPAAANMGDSLEAVADVEPEARTRPTDAPAEPVDQAHSAPIPAPVQASRPAAAAPRPSVKAPTFRTVRKDKSPEAARPPAPATTRLVDPADPVPAMAPSIEGFVEDVIPDADLKQEAPPDASQAVSLSASAVVLSSDNDSVPESKRPTPLAVEFIRWLQQGMAKRELKFNEVGAMVHFVPEGMALVSPLIFREFRKTHPATDNSADSSERVGMDVQRDVFKAGWHLPASAGANIHEYAVVKKGGIRMPKSLSVVILTNPARWVVPVPPPNPALVSVAQLTDKRPTQPTG